MKATFFFITRDSEGLEFALDHARDLGIRNPLAVIDPNPTGTANTVFTGFSLRPYLRLNQPVLIHVVDTFRPDFQLPENIQAGFAEFCLPLNSSTVDRYLGLPKEPPSGQSEIFHWGRSLPRLKGTGLYYMPDGEQLMDAFLRVRAKSEKSYGVQQGFRRFGVPQELVEGLSFLKELRRHKVQPRIIHRNDVIFCGIPSEYEALRKHWPQRGVYATTVPEEALTA